MDEGQAAAERPALREDSRLDDLADGEHGEAEYGSETPEQYRARLARNYATSLRVWWAREFGYVCLLDPFTGEVHECLSQEVPRWMIWRAMDEKHRRRGTSSDWRGRASSG
jgi:hypothetical protein